MRKYQKPSIEVIELKMEGQILQFSGVNASPVIPDVDLDIDLGLDTDVFDDIILM